MQLILQEKQLLHLGKRGLPVETAIDETNEGLFDYFQHKKIKDLAYYDPDNLENKLQKEKIKSFKNNYELEENLETIYEDKKMKYIYFLILFISN